MNIVRELLSDKSPISSMRFMSITALLCACGIGVAGLFMGRDLVGLAALCSAFIAPAFAAKFGQKLVESKGSNET
jgi:hypothetical protein